MWLRLRCDWARVCSLESLARGGTAVPPTDLILLAQCQPQIVEHDGYQRIVFAGRFSFLCERKPVVRFGIPRVERGQFRMTSRDDRGVLTLRRRTEQIITLLGVFPVARSAAAKLSRSA